MQIPEYWQIPFSDDNGMEYPIYTEALCEKMRQLAEKASMITPNLTEALLLLYGKKKCIAGGSIYPPGNRGVYGWNPENRTEDRRELHTEAVITGIDLYTKSADKEAEMANLIVNESNWEWVTAKKEGGSYSGTGDLFASVLSAGMVKGMDTAETVKRQYDLFPEQSMIPFLREQTAMKVCASKNIWVSCCKNRSVWGDA